MQSLFISYCWQDGAPYADDLEGELKKQFKVKRDKSSLKCNDNIEEFMRKIADCDNVVIVLTKQYLHSKNCMKEVAYLSKQPDWSTKCVVLVIYNEVYSLDAQEEILAYWEKQKVSLEKELKSSNSKTLCKEEFESILDICNTMENFLLEVKHRNNPSQIKIVNEIMRLSERNRDREKEIISSISNKVQEVINSKGKTTLSEIESETGYSKEVVDRFVGNLKDKQIAMFDKYGNIRPGMENEIVAHYLVSVGKKNIDELTEDEYGELEQAIGSYHNHL